MDAPVTAATLSGPAAPRWLARLALDYAVPAGEPRRTALQFTHDGPLRVLKSLYPEGPVICHNVLVHPPGGLVGGDVLEIDVQVREGAHALVTTPGATRFYRSNGQTARQLTRLQLAAGARLEWLPLETLAYADCDAHNALTWTLAPEAQLLAWDITALGLPAAGQPFEQGQGSGRLVQHLHWPGHFLEHGVIAAQDRCLLDGPLGLAGRRSLGTLVLACGTPLPRAQLEDLLAQTQARIEACTASGLVAGVTAPSARLVCLRGLAPVVEPLMQLWQQVWGDWRAQLWGLPAQPPRIWAM